MFISSILGNLLYRKRGYCPPLLCSWQTGNFLPGISGIYSGNGLGDFVFPMERIMLEWGIFMRWVWLLFSCFAFFLTFRLDARSIEDGACYPVLRTV